MKHSERDFLQTAAEAKGKAEAPPTPRPAYPKLDRALQLEPASAVRLDLAGLTPPVALLRLARAMKALPPGGEVEAHTGSADLDADLKAFQVVTGNPVRTGDSPGSFRIRKK